MSWIGVITNAGRALLDQWSAGGHTLTIDGATVGSGITQAANMRIATALANEVEDAAIVRTDILDDSSVRFKVQVSASSASAYIATEIGLWAHLDNDEDSTLIALHQDASGGVAIPASADTPDFAFALYLIHTISNASELNVTISPNVFVTNQTLQEMADDLREELAVSWATPEEVQIVIDDALNDSSIPYVPGGGGGGGESSYDTATDDEVQELIDDLFPDTPVPDVPGGGDDDELDYDTATDDEVQELIDDLFPD